MTKLSIVYNYLSFKYSFILSRILNHRIGDDINAKQEKNHLFYMKKKTNNIHLNNNTFSHSFIY
jgi:hypothetical protein